MLLSDVGAFYPVVMSLPEVALHVALCRRRITRRPVDVGIPTSDGGRRFGQIRAETPYRGAPSEIKNIVFQRHPPLPFGQGVSPASV